MMIRWRNASTTSSLTLGILGLGLLLPSAKAQGLAQKPAPTETLPMATPTAVPTGPSDSAAASPASVAVVARQSLATPVPANGVELTWLGHAAWLLRAPSGTTVLIDPWLTNPRAPQDFVLPERVDAILVSHGHADHLGETVALAKRFGAPVVGSYEMIEQLGLEHGIGGNAGGTVQVKDLQVHLTQAVHSSSLPMPPAPADPARHGACGCHHGADGAMVASKDGATPVPAHGACGCHHAEGGAQIDRLDDAATPEHGACGCYHGADGEAVANPVTAAAELPLGATSTDKNGAAPTGQDGQAAQPRHRHGARGGQGAHGRNDHAHAEHKHHRHSGGKNGHGDDAKHHGKAAMVHGVHAAAEATQAAASGRPAAPGELLPFAPQAAAEAGHAGQCAEHPHGVGEHCEHGHHDHHGDGPHRHAHYAGAALGFVIELEGGPKVYHAGDTDVFLDMELIGRRYAPDIALLPIGGHYTMGPKDAAMAVKMLQAKEVLPMHYATMPQLKGTAEALRQAVGKAARVTAPNPGARVTFAPKAGG